MNVEEAVDDPAPSSKTTSKNSDDEYTQKIIAIAQTKPKGILDADITKSLPNLEPTQKANIINKLLSQGRLTLGKRGSDLVYRLADASKTASLKCSDSEERIVCNIVEQAGTKGIWIREIRVKSQLTPNQLTKILKNLESKRVIKSVKSVEVGKRLLYMLYNLEPDVSITGGVFYQDQDFETEFVDVLNKQCYRFLEQRMEAAKDYQSGPIGMRHAQCATSQEVQQFISDLKISKIPLTLDDIEKILNTLIYDGKVQMIPNENEDKLYRAIPSLVPTPGLMQSPCGLCPVMKNCCDAGDVTPIKCEYIKQWLIDSM